MFEITEEELKALTEMYMMLGQIEVKGHNNVALMLTSMNSLQAIINNITGRDREKKEAEKKTKGGQT